MTGSTTARNGMAAGEQAFHEAKDWAEETVSKVTDALSETSGSLSDSFEAAIHERPYTTIAIALGFGVALGFILRR